MIRLEAAPDFSSWQSDNLISSYPIYQTAYKKEDERPSTAISSHSSLGLIVW